MVCPNEVAVPFAPIGSANDSQLVFQTDRGMACNFPQFRLVGRSDETQRDIEVALSGITIAALD